MKQVKFGVAGHFLENASREWPEILYADISWPPSELIRFLVLVCWFFTFWHYFDLGFPGIFQRTHGGNGLKFCMVMYLDYLQNRLIYSVDLLIFQILALFGISGHFPENAWREWPEILYAAVSSSPSDLIRLWSRSGKFFNFGAILTLWKGSNLWSQGISWRTHGGNGLKFCTMMYPDHLQNWLDYGHGLLIFLILTLFWHSEMGQIWDFQSFPGEAIEKMAWHFACWCILTTFRTDQIMITVCWFF